MVPWSHLRQPSSGWVSTVLNSEFTHFNLVIHLSKSQQLALPFCTFLWSPAAPVVPWDPGEILFYWVKLCRTFRNLLFCSTFTATFCNITWKWIRQAHVFQVWSFPFGCLVRWKHVVHLIRWNLKAVLCPCGWLEHGPVVAQSHEQ